MKLLLDTHIALWAIADDSRLPKEARELIADPDNDKFVSVASIWEIAIKHAAQKRGVGRMPISGAEAVEHFDEAGYQVLPITASHAAAIDRLPPHHADPFDRMLVAQALEEPLRLLTHDKRLAAYSDTMILV